MSLADVHRAVRERYTKGAREPDAELCCPVEYDPKYLSAIPPEVLERDYGCGDPSRYVYPGETVLDLGCGSGKICFIASQVVGPAGRVIGIDMTSEMLEVARRNSSIVAEEIGYGNVEFLRGRIQDLALDVELLDRELAARPAASADAFLEAGLRAEELRRSRPLIRDSSIDAVVSNCVLNLVPAADRPRLFAEIHRVLRPGGRAVISDIVSDEPVPQHLQEDAELWSGCVSGAFTEEAFLAAFDEAGFYGMRIRERQGDPWRSVEGIEFRSTTVEAFKGKEGPCLERLQAVVYKGPFREVLDDDGHRIERGKRYAVCDKTFRLLGREPYAGHFDLIEPREEVALEDASPFDCSRDTIRHPRETKGEDYRLTTDGPSCCEPGSCC